MANENIFLFYALAMGIFITFLYDILRIIRRVLPHNHFWVSVEDLSFWIYCAAEVFLLLHHESNGALRWFAVLGALTGMLLYKKLVSPFFVKYVSFALGKLVFFLGKVSSFLAAPFLKAAKALENKAKGAGRKAVKHGSRAGRLLKKKLTLFVKMLKMTL